MTYTPTGPFVNVTPGTTPAAGTPKIDAAFFNRLEAGIVEAQTTAVPGGTVATDLSSLVINVRAAAYGAKGNGVANDTAPMQAALDAASAAGGGVVVFPAGTYNLGGALRVGANTTIVAYGATIKQTATGGGLLYNFQAADNFTAYNGRGNIVVLGGTWDCNAANAGVGTVTGGFNGMFFHHASGITVRDATITNVSSSHAIELNSVERARIENCRFLGYKDNSGDNSRQFSEAIQLDSATAVGGAIPAYDDTTCRDVTITGCYVGASSRLGTWGGFVGTHGHTTAQYYTDIRVINNRVNGTLREAISTIGWRRSLVADNVISGVGSSGTASAISLSTVDPATGVVAPVDTVTVRGNLIDGASGGGIALGYCTDGEVVGNTIRNVGSLGIYLGGCTGGVVADNLIDGSVSHGINLSAQFSSNCSGVLLANNQIRAAASNGTAAGIRLSAGSPNNTIAGNQIKKGTGSTAFGISVDASSTGCVVVGNDLSGNSWTAANAVQINAGAASKTDYAGGTAVPGHNLI